MKTCSKLTQWIVGLTACCCAFGFQSCKEDNYSYYVLPYPNALVTVKPQQDNSFYLQLDDSTTLLPTNLATSPFGEKEVRALVNYVETDEAHGNYSKAVHINWIDSILTKPIAPLLGSDNDAVYGTDPVEIVNDWVTLAEDGYLTLRFRTLRSDMGKAHFVNLLHVPEADNPDQRKNLRSNSDKIVSLPTIIKKDTMETNGYRLLLPEGTLDYFTISDVKESSTEIVIYLEEKNEAPQEYSESKVESKGFYDPIVVQDFPIRGKKVFLNIRRRRWVLKDENRYVSRNWKLVAQGSRMTQEFATFLKELY